LEAFLTIFSSLSAKQHSLIFQDGATPLFLAAQEGHVTVIRQLLSSGAKVNQARQVISFKGHRSSNAYTLLSPAPSSEGCVFFFSKIWKSQTLIVF